jgi:uncharacterized protein
MVEALTARDGTRNRRAVPSLSAEVFVIPLEDARYIVYAPLRRAAFVANARVVNFLAALKVGVFEECADPDGALVELLRRLEIVDAGPETRPITTLDGEPEPVAVTLFLTTGCNLRCTYCYASGGDAPLKHMGMDVARRGIDFVANNAARREAGRVKIAYHGGGEPALNWAVLKASFEYARRRASAVGLEVYASTATNGVLSDRQIDWIVANLNGATVSFDGLPQVHDKHRPTASGKGSSARVMHTLRRFDEAGFRYGLRVTVTADQIAMLPDSVEFICSNFCPTRIQVEPAYNMGRWRDAPSAETGEFIAAYRVAQERARGFGREINFSAARIGTLTNHFCGITEDNFSLSPDGNVSACYEVFSEDDPWATTFFYGKPKDKGEGYEFDLTVLNNLRSQAVQHRDYCQGCFARWTCAGDCYRKSLSFSREGEFAGTDRCHITRELTRDQILAKIVASGGLFWHQPLVCTADAQAARETLL